MKNVGLFLVIVMGAASAFAQSTVRTTSPTPPRDSQSGFQVGVVRPNFVFRVDFEGTGKDSSGAALASSKGSGKADIDNSIGVTAGYGSVPMRGIGWGSNFSLFEIKIDGFSANLVRLDANAVYALNPTVSLRAGPNTAKFTT